MENRVLAIIPARSGSKGLIDKNIKLLDGKPMIAYTIEAAVDSKVFDYVMVSTDSESYSNISKEYGAKVPFLRTSELSNDTASSADVIIDCIKRLRDMGMIFEYFALLQPTSPLRTKEDIIQSWRLIKDKNANAVVSLSETKDSPLISNVLNDERKIDNFLEKLKELKSVRRQDIPKYYKINGALYFSKVDYYEQYRDFYKENAYAYIMDKYSSIDVDDEIDFMLAELLIRKRK